jgi:signal transduction histidine kinase
MTAVSALLLALIAGAGLLGMTERVKAHGGQISAGPAIGGGWRITASLPRPAR